MTGKKTVFIIIAFTIIVLILAWFWLQHIVEKYDIDRAMDTTNILISHVKSSIQLPTMANKL